MSLLAELKRRNVFKVGAAYLVVAWLVVQAASIAFPTFEAPAWALRVFIFVLLLGFPLALVIAWMLQLTPEGVRVERAAVGNKRMLAIAAVLAALATGWFFRGQPAVPEVSTGQRSIAVLPFTSLGADAESTGLAGGLHDTLITQLSKLKGLEVRSRTSVMKYKDWKGGLKTIADELEVAVLLEGSVQRIGNRTVVNAQLIDARTDAHLWAETFDRTSDDLFALQAEIAHRVASGLQLALTPAERKTLSEAPTEDREAYALYVQGLRVLNDAASPMPESEREAGRKRSAELLEAAVTRDPGFAAAWASLSNAYASIAWDTRYSDYRGYAAKARTAAEKAVTFGAELPEARFARGVVALQLDFDFARAVLELEQAIRDAPGNAEFHSTLSLAYRYMGRWEESARSIRKALELDPTDSSYAIALRNGLFGLRRMEEVLALSRQIAALHADEYSMVRIAPEAEAWIAADFSVFERFVRGAGAGFDINAESIGDLWLVEMANGDYAAALAAVESAPADKRPDFANTMRGDALRLLGREAEAQAAYAAYRDENLALLQADRDPFVEASTRAYLAYGLARLGDAEGARANIAKADALWGHAREPSDGGRVWLRLLPAHLALGEQDEAFAKARVLVEQPSYYPAGRLWLSWEAAELHSHEGFRKLMQAHGVDVSREPFAFNRAAAPVKGN